jgi:hypothetical protein
MRKIDKVIIHCSDSEFGNAERITEWHKEKGWSTIGYHFVINNGYVFSKDWYEQRVKDGQVELGRPEDIAGAHCYGQNSNSIGICMIGIKYFSNAQFDSLKQILNTIMEKYNLTLDNIYGHYDFSEYKTCPNFDVNEYKKKYLGA